MCRCWQGLSVEMQPPLTASSYSRYSLSWLSDVAMGACMVTVSVTVRLCGMMRCCGVMCL